MEAWSVLNEVYAFKVFGNKPGGDCLDILEGVSGRSLMRGLMVCILHCYCYMWDYWRRRMWVQHAACTGKNRRCVHAFGNVHPEDKHCIILAWN